MINVSEAYSQLAVLENEQKHLKIILNDYYDNAENLTPEEMDDHHHYFSARWYIKQRIVELKEELGKVEREY